MAQDTRAQGVFPLDMRRIPKETRCIYSGRQCIGQDTRCICSRHAVKWSGHVMYLLLRWSAWLKAYDVFALVVH